MREGDAKTYSAAKTGTGPERLGSNRPRAGGRDDAIINIDACELGEAKENAAHALSVRRGDGCALSARAGRREKRGGEVN